MHRWLMLLLFVSPAVLADSVDEVIDDYWSHVLSEFPLAAKQAGLDSSNDRFASVTPESQARRLGVERRLLARLRDIGADRLSAEDRFNSELLQWVLEDSVGAYELDLSRMPFNTFSGFFMQALTAANGIRFDDAADYDDYISRLEDMPRFFSEHLDNMRRGMQDGFVLPQIVIDGVLPTIEAQLKEEPEQSAFFDPFRAMTATLTDAERAELRQRGRRAIQDSAIPSFAALATFLRDEYTASDTLGAEALPGGEVYYAFQIRRYTTLTDASSDDIHETGLAEVRRIREAMRAIVEETGFDGDLDDFVEFLRTDPQFYAETPEALLKEAAWIAKRIDYRMPGFFRTLPRQSYGVVPVPDEIAPNYTTGAYYGAPPGGDVGGAFWVNTHALDQRPLYELPALTLHEAVPGHHHQHALALEIPEAPDFRKQLYFSAFGEGWALYTEHLGIEMGIYRTPYEHFGRLSYEMWRACRLVIDTGIHSRGWSRAQAQEYLRANTSLSESNIRAEVDRYISWPGQALAYKLGELKIRELRARAEQLLGDRFDLPSFHDTLLTAGAMPLAMLERRVERYIDENLEND